MMTSLKMELLLGILLFIPILSNAFISDDGYEQCEHAVKKWASSSTGSEVKHDKHELRDLLFFLHVPRTGGRTYFQCFLKKLFLFPNFDECPRSYDKLRFDPRNAKCRLLSTHDDYSMMSKLPKEKTSVVTVLRNPIDRVFSTYEFSIEVASRFLVFPNLTSMDRMTKRVRSKATGVSTLDIWPWKYLVPWMRQDLFARRDARKMRGQSYLFTNNSYDMGEILMPLHEYINDPIALDNVHNGATFQIAGLTNNSYFSESHRVRHCVLKYPSLSEYVLDVAKKRLGDMLFVGLTENHKESATVFANVVGEQVISQHTSSNVASDSEKSSAFSDTNSSSLDQGNKTLVLENDEQEAERKNLTSTEKLMKAYESCVVPLRKAQADRRVKSLKKISPANFTKEARLKVPEALLQEIASLNSLDVELYKYAQNIFAKQHAQVTERVVSAVSYTQRVVSAETHPNILNESLYLSFYSPPSWRFMFLAMTGLLLLFVFLFVNARKRTSKVKL